MSVDNKQTESEKQPLLGWVINRIGIKIVKFVIMGTWSVHYMAPSYASLYIFFFTQFWNMWESNHVFFSLDLVIN